VCSSCLLWNHLLVNPVKVAVLGDRGLLRAGFPVAGEEVEDAIGVDVQDDLDLLRPAGSTAGWLSSASVSATTDGWSVILGHATLPSPCVLLVCRW
jgi:hypothetical protein